MLLQTCKNKIVLPPNPEDVMMGSRGSSEAEAGAGVAGLPDDALICSCESVSKGISVIQLLIKVANLLIQLRNVLKLELAVVAAFPW
jgi:NAD(P)H-nitrite reductase large subunit